MSSHDTTNPSDPHRQPWLHDLVTSLCAPTTAASAADGQIRPRGAEGVIHTDIRVLSRAELTVNGAEPDAVAGAAASAGEARFTSFARGLGNPGPDPTVLIERVRTVRPGQVEERIDVRSYADAPVVAEIAIALGADLARIETIKSGGAGAAVAMRPAGDGTLRWGDEGVDVLLLAHGADIRITPAGARAVWTVSLGPSDRRILDWRLHAEVADAPLVAAPGDVAGDVTVQAGDHRLPLLVRRSLEDLRALQLAPADSPSDTFLAAGSPWYFTLFGRDSIWAARMMLPFGTEIAAGTLRALAARQGTRVDVETAEEPGKILHELRMQASAHAGGHGPDDMVLPPQYYGTVDATPLWISLLHDAWRHGMPEDEVRALLPNLVAALNWMSDHGDPDGDGFLEYIDETGRGLTNQGWKDSGDSVRFNDGTIATGPVALCEVQGYAYEAAVVGADLLEAFGLAGAEHWRAWAARLAERFRAAFWVDDAEGGYPALALDGAKRKVDSLTSNIGHLLGTGLLSDAESAQVARRVTARDMDSGFGLRTMSDRAGGYSPSSYHCGSVWAHDTAIVIRGLQRAGHADQARGLIEGLLAAGVHFDGRVPELYAGLGVAESPWPVPYPAACRPQAWSAAAAAVVLAAVLGLDVNVPAGVVQVRPMSPPPVGQVSVAGLRAGEERYEVTVGPDGWVGVDGLKVLEVTGPSERGTGLG